MGWGGVGGGGKREPRAWRARRPLSSLPFPLSDHARPRRHRLLWRRPGADRVIGRPRPDGRVPQRRAVQHRERRARHRHPPPPPRRRVRRVGRHDNARRQDHRHRRQRTLPHGHQLVRLRLRRDDGRRPLGRPRRGRPRFRQRRLPHQTAGVQLGAAPIFVSRPVRAEPEMAQHKVHPGAAVRRRGPDQAAGRVTDLPTPRPGPGVCSIGGRHVQLVPAVDDDARPLPVDGRLPHPARVVRHAGQSGKGGEVERSGGGVAAARKEKEKPMPTPLPSPSLSSTSTRPRPSSRPSGSSAGPTWRPG